MHVSLTASDAGKKKPTALPRWVFGFPNLNWLAPASD
jgi:hypothetical protein